MYLKNNKKLQITYLCRPLLSNGIFRFPHIPAKLMEILKRGCISLDSGMLFVLIGAFKQVSRFQYTQVPFIMHLPHFEATF